MVYPTFPVGTAPPSLITVSSRERTARKRRAPELALVLARGADSANIAPQRCVVLMRILDVPPGVSKGSSS